MEDPISTRTFFAPTTALEAGEHVATSFHSDKATYWREHAWLAAIAMAAGMVILWAMGNPHVWTGAIGGLAAIAIRGFYLASDETKMRWDLTDRRLLGPGPRVIWLRDIEKVRGIFSAVQVVTTSGDKYLLKYQPDIARTIAEIDAARARRGA